MQKLQNLKPCATWLAAKILSAILFFAAASPALAGLNSPVIFENTNIDSFIHNTGKVLDAWNFGSATTVTRNGVTFTNAGLVSNPSGANWSTSGPSLATNLFFNTNLFGGPINIDPLFYSEIYGNYDVSLTYSDLDNTKVYIVQIMHGEPRSMYVGTFNGNYFVTHYFSTDPQTINVPSFTIGDSTGGQNPPAASDRAIVEVRLGGVTDFTYFMELSVNGTRGPSIAGFQVIEDGSNFPPVVDTISGPAVTDRSATLQGTVILYGQSDATSWFNWGTTTAFGKATAANPLPAVYTVCLVSNVLSGLQPLTTYYFAVAAANTTGTTVGDPQSFTTLGYPPVVTTQPAANVSNTLALLNGTVNPNGEASAFWFKWGTTTNYGNVTATSNLSASFLALAVSNTLSGLQSLTTYHFALVASNSSGTSIGSDTTFTTLGFPPIVTTQPAGNVTDTLSLLNGTVNPNGLASATWFKWGTTISYGNVTATSNLSAGFLPLAFSNNLSGLQPLTTYHFALVATNKAGTSTGSDASFTTLGFPPVVATQPAANVSNTLAMINGTVNPNGLAGATWFKWGTTISYGNVTATSNLSAGFLPLAFSNNLSGLQPLTTYHFALVATNKAGTSTGSDASFTTLGFPPVVATQPAANVSNTLAMINGTVNPNGQASATWFEWGATASYGNFSATNSLAAGFTPLAFSDALSGLQPLTTYHFAIVATNIAGTSISSDTTFTTQNLSPTVTTVPATVVGANVAALNGIVNPNGLAGACWFMWGTSASYGNFTATNSLAAGYLPLTFSDALSGLQPLTIYHFAMVATNSSGTSVGSDATFTTPASLPVVTTQPATGLTSGIATLNGTVNPAGFATTVWFEWGPFAPTNTTQTTPQSVGGGTVALAVSNHLSGLTSGFIYYGRLVASNAYGVVRGPSVPFGSPIVALVGGSVVTNECHFAFTDPGATVSGGLLAIAAGDFSSLVLKSDGTVVAWGNDYANQLEIPAGLSNVVAIAVGATSCLALKSDGTVAEWGDYGQGQSELPAGLSNQTAIAAGDDQALGLNRDGTVLGWGSDASGQIDVPLGLSNVVAIAAGDQFSLALKSDGTVVGWGDNSENELNIPAGLSNVVAIATKELNCLALKSDGTVVGWGGNSNQPQSQIPSGLSNIMAIAVGGTASMVLSSNGTVRAWGDSSIPTNFPASWSNIVSIAQGGYWNLALKNDGTVLVMGGIYSGNNTNIPAGLTNLNVTVTQTGSLDVNNPGSYPQAYTATNFLEGIGTAARTVLVADTIPPVVTLLGVNPILITNLANLPLVDPGATALDLCGGILPAIASNHVNVNYPGTYAINYYSTDASGNVGLATRTVVVALPPAVPGDVNGDGIVDQTELATILSHLDPNGAVNASNFDAVLANYLASSPPLITSTAGLGQSQVTFALTNSFGGTFTVQSSTNLTTWESIGQATPSFLFTDTNAPGLPHIYYRLRYP